ncbi:hypothetical protein HK104_007496, partial [Borealophlyctis nickersoniae]
MTSRWNIVEVPAAKVTSDNRWKSFRRSLQTLPNLVPTHTPSFTLHATDPSSSSLSSPSASTTPPPLLSRGPSIDSTDAVSQDSDTTDPITSVISEYVDTPVDVDEEVGADYAASVLKLVEDTIRGLRLEGGYDSLVRGLYCLADVVRHGPQE